MTFGFAATVASAAQSITGSVRNLNYTTLLEALRLDLTRLYIDHGYIISGAIIPDQTVTDGVITLHRIEGRLHDIEVAGQRWFRSGYFRLWLLGRH
jgi:hemolysin activation/secretion protein